MLGQLVLTDQHWGRLQAVRSAQSPHRMGELPFQPVSEGFLGVRGGCWALGQHSGGHAWEAGVLASYSIQLLALEASTQHLGVGQTDGMVGPAPHLSPSHGGSVAASLSPPPQNKSALALSSWHSAAPSWPYSLVQAPAKARQAILHLVESPVADALSSKKTRE